MTSVRALTSRFLDATATLGWRIIPIAPRFLLRPRYLVLVRDLKLPLPEIPRQEGLRRTILSAADISEIRAIDPSLTAREIHRRLVEGQECHLYWLGSALAHYRWYATQPTYLSFVGRNVRPLDGDVCGGGVYTSRPFRRRGIDSAACIAGLHLFRDRGFARTFVLVAWWNTPSLRVEQDRAGRTLAGSVGRWRLGPWQRHFTEGAVHFDSSGSFFLERGADHSFGGDRTVA
jgi:hypothetical protein